MMNNVPDEATRARNRLARERALEALQGIRPAPTGIVRYLSQGRVAVIGGMEALELAPGLRGSLRPTVLLLEGAEEPGVDTVPVGGRPLAIEGHLGNFTLRLGEPGRPGYEKLRVDLVLDLSPQPLLEMPLPPPGYLWSSLGEDSLEEARQQLEELVGTFEKPRFVQYDAARCAHRRAGQVACTRCIDACPAEAIRSMGEGIEVDADRCQGGGICATACPSGALGYSWPGVEDALEQVKALLHRYRDAGGKDPVLVLVAEGERELAGGLPSNHLPFEVEELASRGIEFWFGALAYGARRVLLLSQTPRPGRVESALEEQLETGRRVLEALGYPADALQHVHGGADSVLTGPGMPPLEAALHAPVGEKRQLFFMALDHLHQQAERAKPLVTLEAGAPFGTASIDGERCTLCNACVGACPGSALQLSGDTPSIRFLEANCLQCGMCTRTCPEEAITITPRLLFDRDQRNRSRLLHGEEPFHCVGCGKPFATRSVIDRMQRALQGHWMYQDERARQRLKMCDQCRVVDMARDGEALEQTGGMQAGGLQVGH